MDDVMADRWAVNSDGFIYERQPGGIIVVAQSHFKNKAAELVAAANTAERYRAALEKIRDLDPAEDSDEGLNEWGEADMFNKAQEIARAALSEQEGQ
jgi:hypothetical protein